jgi:hypothetical protein
LPGPTRDVARAAVLRIFVQRGARAMTHGLVRRAVDRRGCARANEARHDENKG